MGPTWVKMAPMSSPGLAGVDLAAITMAYRQHYQRSAADAGAWDLVDGVGRGRASDPAVAPLLLFGELAVTAVDDGALAYLGSGPLEDYLGSDALDLDLLAEAVQANESLSRAFRFAYLPMHLPPAAVSCHHWSGGELQSTEHGVPGRQNPTW